MEQKDGCFSNNIVLHKCGVRFDPPAFIIAYEENNSGKLHKRSMPIRNFTKSSSVDFAAQNLQSHPRHGKYLASVPQWQLQKMLTLVQMKMKGCSLEESLQEASKSFTVSSTEDLNKVDDETLRKKKAVMEESFQKNQKKSSDPDFQYDVEVEFGEPSAENNEWDSD